MTKRSKHPRQCSISGCGRYGPLPPNAQVTPEKIHVPVCTFHAVAIWRQVQIATMKTPYVDDLLMLERVIKAELPKARVTTPRPEWIYFVALNGLIKVGWSTQLDRRLRDYGPSVEILCHYPGTRQDETELHQILTPFRANGREWYHDSPMIRKLIAEKVAEHGEPHIKAHWTAPPKSATKPKRWAA